ncbi:hypothetical protein FVE85_0102 [Porphyridium purpureum]|uniref:Uncharacterized protein n=1 Tax=Porphyridium purpureum TaxID=35688 RepID=A0A5J4Z0K7_PORPP|nr:hypothetical protein FVE85_0102 [Porphyridium purpureum]|eukprot:POR2375..scf208_2
MRVVFRVGRSGRRERERERETGEKMELVAGHDAEAGNGGGAAADMRVPAHMRKRSRRAGAVGSIGYLRSLFVMPRWLAALTALLLLWASRVQYKLQYCEAQGEAASAHQTAIEERRFFFLPDLDAHHTVITRDEIGSSVENPPLNFAGDARLPGSRKSANASSLPAVKAITAGMKPHKLDPETGLVHRVDLGCVCEPSHPSKCECDWLQWISLKMVNAPPRSMNEVHAELFASRCEGGKLKCQYIPADWQVFVGLSQGTYRHFQRRRLEFWYIGPDADRAIVTLARQMPDRNMTMQYFFTKPDSSTNKNSEKSMKAMQVAKKELLAKRTKKNLNEVPIEFVDPASVITMMQDPGRIDSIAYLGLTLPGQRRQAEQLMNASIVNLLPGAYVELYNPVNSIAFDTMLSLMRSTQIDPTSPPSIVISSSGKKTEPHAMFIAQARPGSIVPARKSHVRATSSNSSTKQTSIPPKTLASPGKGAKK